MDPGGSGGSSTTGGSGTTGSSGSSGGLDAETAKIVFDEITALCARYQDDCKLISNSSPQIEMKLRPKDKGYEDSEVSAALSVRFFPGYPYKCPKLQIIPGRGLSKDDARNLIALLIDQASSNAREGHVMIYKLVEAARELLSAIVTQTSDTRVAFVRYSHNYDEIGKIGAVGRVFRCTHKLDRRDCVIKMVPFNKNDREKTLREVIALRRLPHPRVVRYFECWIEDGVPKGSVDSSANSQRSDDPNSTLFISMEHCPTTLKAKLVEDFDKKQTLHLYKQLMEGLAYMHGEGVVHFNIQPDNLLLDEFGNMKIGGFGLVALPGGKSRLVEDNSGFGWNTTYQAPEVIGKEAHLTEKADIYSAGLVLLEMICSPMATISKRTEVFNNARNKIYPQGIDGLIKCILATSLHKNPKQRLSAIDIISTYF